MELSRGAITRRRHEPSRRLHRLRPAIVQLSCVLLLGGLLACDAGVQRTARALPHRRSKLALSVDGTANGSYWSPALRTLFVSDSAHGRILEWTDDHGFSVAAQLPPGGPSPATPAGLVVLSDGTLVVARTADGASDVLLLVPGSEPALVPGLDPTRRRLGLASSADGEVFASWVDERPSGNRVGLSEFSLGGGEEDVPSSLEMPAGVLLRGDDLFVCDRELGAVLHASRGAPAALAVLARVEGASWLTAGPGADLFAASAGGTVYRIDTGGTVSVFDAGYVGVKGIAYDEQRRRLLVLAEQCAASDAAGPAPPAAGNAPTTLYISSID